MRRNNYKGIAVITFVLLLKVQVSCGQPLITNPVEIDNIFINKNVSCFTTNNDIDYLLFKKVKSEKCDNTDQNKALISVNEYSNFIYGKDTMKIKILFDKYSPLRFSVKKLYFTKGNFIINLKECMRRTGVKADTYPIIIEQIPCDCKL